LIQYQILHSYTIAAEKQYHDRGTLKTIVHLSHLASIHI
jgi:hypothetical protein